MARYLYDVLLTCYLLNKSQEGALYAATVAV